MNTDWTGTPDAARFWQPLLEWYAHNGRTLPWRGLKDPYAVWVSEIILQQTRIDQGTAYWQRFMEQYPTVDRLASASEDEVLRLWQGLGYYSRARNLHRAAQQVVQWGGFPETAREIVRLKGVGTYTAAAIASMVFGQDEAAIDGNAYRVLSRHFGISTPIDSTQGKREFQQLATALLPEGKAGDFNQAMMDLGAMVCTPRSPQCGDCPLGSSCEARRTGVQQSLPVKARNTAVKERHMRCVCIRCNGETAICRRSAGDIWQGLWQPLVVEDEGEWKAFLGKLGEDSVLHTLNTGVRHVLTHRIITADFYVLDTGRKPDLPSGYIWIPRKQLDDHALPRLFERLFDEAEQNVQDAATDSR